MTESTREIIRLYDDSGERLEVLRNQHRGQRVFSIGTGESLNLTDFQLIKDEILFGVNTLYGGLDRYGIKCRYWGVSDPESFRLHWKHINVLDTTIFLTHGAAAAWMSNHLRSGSPNGGAPILCLSLADMLNGTYTKAAAFGGNPQEALFHGGTVVIDCCLGLTYWMGADAYLIGCDHDYSGKQRFDGKPSWNRLPHEYWDDTVSPNYLVCQKAFENDGRKLINCTVGGRLEVLERKTLAEVMPG